MSDRANIRIVDIDGNHIYLHTRLGGETILEDLRRGLKRATDNGYADDVPTLPLFIMEEMRHNHGEIPFGDNYGISACLVDPGDNPLIEVYPEDKRIVIDFSNGDIYDVPFSRYIEQTDISWETIRPSEAAIKTYKHFSQYDYLLGRINKLEQQIKELKNDR